MIAMGYIGAAMIGITLGLTGGGGSILTMPVLVYLFGISPIVAAAYSLFIVGSSSLVGAASKIRHQLVSYHSVLYFGLPSLLAVFATRKWLMPVLPEVIFAWNDFTVTKGGFTLVAFSVLMIIAGIGMIRNKEATAAAETLRIHPLRIGVQGVGTGLITGLVGAGGGFLIVPALIWMLRLPVKTAIGSSLLIIAINSLAGFAGDVMNYTIDWPLVLTIAGISIVGIFIGNRLQGLIPSGHLKKGFGWFVLGMGIYIILKELFL
ncbi:sulfite exporter TauE/SafE family protein [Paraflavitalea soli]|uniref:Probable membrane transporter protein n=1 Tax=Paraflavitalea soli TaxID=2315862 RepID=A0A3B7MPA4_9BACT|nr:sulfite exporter TauE/SafE family protein [Paraflavitalea soli]AXY76332.1 sulfite exporter TauE/SafE family protein [Paraflavitalea soli]